MCSSQNLDPPGSAFTLLALWLRKSFIGFCMCKAAWGGRGIWEVALSGKTAGDRFSWDTLGKEHQLSLGSGHLSHDKVFSQTLSGVWIFHGTLNHVVQSLLFKYEKLRSNKRKRFAQGDIRD